MEVPLISAEEAAYFLNVAVIAGTLLGLSFVTLAFFLSDLLKRYEETGLPVFRVADPAESIAGALMSPPESFTDEQLFDKDPLVVFMAFSVAVTWNLFLLPLVIGLTVAWAGVRLEALAAELLFWFFVLWYCFSTRNSKIAELKPYLTREEVFWPVLGRAALILFGTGATVVVIAAISNLSPGFARLIRSLPLQVSPTRAAVFLIKVMCIFALLMGTYTTNKDMFIFFKSVALERTRRRWLQSFLRETYTQLQARVTSISQQQVRNKIDEEVLEVWNRGPALISMHKAVRTRDAKHIWNALISGHEGTPSWMLDIPVIAGWAARLQHFLDTRYVLPTRAKYVETLKSLRLPRKFESKPVTISPDEKKTVEQVAEENDKQLSRNYLPGFGVFPSSDPNSNFYNQVYSRDFAHAAGNRLAETNADAVKDSLGTILRYQKENGMLPLRVEREYQQLKLWPGVRSLAKPLFDLFEKRIKGKEEHPVYEGGDLGASGAEDTVPAMIVAAGEFFIASEQGQKFVSEHYDQIVKAAEFFRTKTDSSDGLATIKRGNADWADSIQRTGKLGGINICWARSLRLLEFMAKQLGREEESKEYKEEFRKVKHSVMEKLYNSGEGYFRAKEGEDRIDTVASIFGALYFLSPEEAVKVQETLERRTKSNSGLRNFDPPYPSKEIFVGHRLMGKLAKIKGVFTGRQEHGFDEYHDKFVWPWVTLENIQVKIKIALQHKSEEIREKYKKEAVEDLLAMSTIFQKAGGAYELLDPDDAKPGSIVMYSNQKHMMGSMAAYQGAYSQIKTLGWI